MISIKNFRIHTFSKKARWLDKARAREKMGYQSNMTSFIRELRKMHEAILSRATEKATKLKPTIKITFELKEGYTPSKIVEAAADGEFDLIVLGHRGDSQIKELFLGSTSERVAHQATCPVLIIK